MAKASLMQFDVGLDKDSGFPGIYSRLLIALPHAQHEQGIVYGYDVDAIF